MGWASVALVTLLLLAVSWARNYRPGEIVQASWTSSLPTAAWTELHLTHCPRFGRSGKYDFFLRKDHFNPTFRLAFGFEKHKYITPYIAAAQDGGNLVRVDITLVSNGRELVGVRWNAWYKAPAVKSPTMRGLKQVDEEAPKEGEPWQDQGWPEEEEVPPREIFPEDDEDDSLREEGLRDELEHEGDDTGAVDDFDLPQEAEGETGAAAADEGIIEVYYHWESLPSDDLETGAAYTQVVALVALIAHSIYLIYKNWRARSSGASAAAASAPQAQPQSPVAARPSSGLGFAPSSPLPPSPVLPSSDKEGKSA